MWKALEEKANSVVHGLYPTPDPLPPGDRVKSVVIFADHGQHPFLQMYSCKLVGTGAFTKKGSYCICNSTPFTRALWVCLRAFSYQFIGATEQTHLHTGPPSELVEGSGPARGAGRWPPPHSRPLMARGIVV